MSNSSHLIGQDLNPGDATSFCLYKLSYCVCGLLFYLSELPFRMCAGFQLSLTPLGLVTKKDISKKKI